MAAKLAYIPRYTAEDLARWEDRWELIEGVPHAMSPAPAIRHQQLSARLHVLLAEALETCEACHALLAVNWRISDETVVIPDNLVVCTDEPPEGVYLTQPPALVAEVLSPVTALKDRTAKHALYEEQGVRHYVLVDPEAELVEAFERERGRYVRRFDGREGTLGLELGPCDLALELARLWKL